MTRSQPENRFYFLIECVDTGFVCGKAHCRRKKYRCPRCGKMFCHRSDHIVDWGTRTVICLTE